MLAAAARALSSFESFPDDLLGLGIPEDAGIDDNDVEGGIATVADGDEPLEDLLDDVDD